MVQTIQKVVSDHRPQFASAFARKLTRLLQYDVALSSAYHLRTNGEIEHYNQELKTYLHIFCEGQSQKWLEHPSLPPSPIPGTQHSKTCTRTFLLLLHHLLPLSLWLVNLWWHPSPQGWTVMNIWDPPPFSPIPPSPPSHSLWDMIINDEGISMEVWDQFVGGDVPSITLWRLSPLPPFFPFPFHLWTYLYSRKHDYIPHRFSSSHLCSCISMIDSSLLPHNHAYLYVSFLLTLTDIASLAVLSLCAAS